MPCLNHPAVEDNLVKCSRCAKPFCQDCVIELKNNFYCIDCKSEQVRDIQSGADSTELEMAGFGIRAAASILDYILIMIPYGVFVLMVLLGAMAAAGPGVMSGASGVLLIILLVLPALMYEGLMLQFKGQTVGKMICKLKVVNPEGGDITPGQAWGRALVRVLLGQVPFGIGWLINYLYALGKDKTCVHDIAAKTRVIYWRQ
jgi:uncharacterized RDD family membrane protein YckC